MKEFRKLIYETHDTLCNQKYGGTLPYSFHLKCVEAQGEEFMHLIKDEYVENPSNYRAQPVNLRDIVRYALIAHDSIEDARLTYNDVSEYAQLDNYLASKMVADIVYCVTDEKGKSRLERKNSKYYSELLENKLAIFVKLADLAANTLFSKMTGSSMYEKYKAEFPHFKDEVYREEFKEFFDYVENL